LQGFVDALLAENDGVDEGEGENGNGNGDGVGDGVGDGKGKRGEIVLVAASESSLRGAAVALACLA
jgi:hypothetical protein